MTDRFDDPDHYPAQLRDLRPPAMPSPSLEERVVRSLRDKGQLRHGHRRRWPIAGYWGGLLAASLAAFWLGRATPRSQADHGPRWMLLLFEDERFVPAPADQPRAYVEEYGRWAGQLGEAFVDGAELGPGGGVIDEPLGSLMPANDATPALGRLTGYFVVAAPTLEAAAAIAKGSPHLRHGGRVAIRPLGGS